MVRCRVRCVDVTYTPAANYSGPDSFTYRANDGTADSNVATVSITVTPAPRPSLALRKVANPQTYSAAGQTITYTYNVTNSGNVSIRGPFTVSDDRIVPTGIRCVQPADGELSPTEAMTCTGTYLIKQADIDAGSVTNTATVTNGVTTSAVAKATVNAERRTGARTIGFWQNKNGQDIIDKYSGTGCQNLRVWLNQYQPFKNLLATSCGSVKAEITKIIKAASSAGPAMNAMLQAQMLATALDVYFSDPALGGNRLNAASPIGAVSVDLTKVCKAASTVGSTCTTGFANVTSAFGGATSLTVMQMLSAAAGQSNIGGTVWYSNVKAAQEKAKDAFEAINNERTLSP